MTSIFKGDDNMGEFIPTYSTDNIWREEDMNRCLSTDLNTIESNITTLQSGKANAAHTHTEYASATDVSALQTLVGDTSVASQIVSAVSSKADASHTHSEYATTDHTHSGYATRTYVDTQVSGLVDSAPEALNTLNELSAALGDDPNFATTIATQIGSKVSQVDGMGLSTNDYTNAEKSKLAGIAENANEYVLPTATSSVLGGVKIGSNITNSSGVISLSGSNVTSALGYTPFNSNNVIPKTKGGTGRDMSDFPANAIIRNSGSGGSDLYYTETNNGAFYATSANGYPTFGTLPVAQGGTGETAAWTNGTITSLNGTTITSCQFAVFPYLNKAFIRMNVLLGSALAADDARYIAMPSTVATAHTALSCYNHSGYDIHCGMSSDSGIYVINCGTASMSTSVRLYIAGWFSI